MEENMGTAPGREKYWSEIDQAEQIKRLREHIKQALRQVEELRQQFNHFEDHDHRDGKIFVPYYRDNTVVPRDRMDRGTSKG